MSSTIIYEQPLNERVRAFLRIEHLFAEVDHFRSNRTVWDSHASVSGLIEIWSILDRTDIRGELLKELDKHIQGLSKLLDTPGVDHFELDKTLQELATHQQKIQLLPSKMGSEVRDNDLLNSVRQRTMIKGGTCGFDIPAYHYWLNQPTSLKTECLSRWLSDIIPIKHGIALVLNLIRGSAFFEHETAVSGFYQRSLDTQHPCQLLRIALPTDSSVYPEVSGNKHRVNVRFLGFSESNRPKQIVHTLDFDLSCCII